jgi:hypothetical protein
MYTTFCAKNNAKHHTNAIEMENAHAQAIARERIATSAFLDIMEKTANPIVIR